MLVALLICTWLSASLLTFHQMCVCWCSKAVLSWIRKQLTVGMFLCMKEKERERVCVCVCVCVCSVLFPFPFRHSFIYKKMPYVEITSVCLWSDISNWTVYWIFMKFSVTVIYKSCQTSRSFSIITEGLSWICGFTFHICQSVGLSSVQKISTWCWEAIVSFVKTGAVQSIPHLGA